MPRSFFTFILYVAVSSAFAQDLIVKKDQTQIFCQIVSVDKLFITYKKPPSKNEFMILRQDVESYNIAQPGALVNSDGQVKTREIVYLGFRAGISNPIGDFGSADPNNEKAGLATTGYLLEGSLLLKASDYFGFLLNYRDQRNPFNTQVLVSAIDPSGRANLKCTADDWRSKGIFAGVGLMLPFKIINNLSLNAELLGGFPMHYYPSLTITYPTLGGAWEKGSAPPVRSFSFDLGLCIFYKANKNLGLYAGCDYLYAKPEFSQTYSNSLGQSGFGTYEQVMNTITLKVGVSIIFLQKIKPNNKS